MDVNIRVDIQNHGRILQATASDDFNTKKQDTKPF